jgi:YD repeat-containing protein
LIRVQDSAGNTASYQYDADGNMLKLTDAKGSQTQWSYDASNRAIRKTYADQHYQAYTYNGGLLSATQNEKGQITNYQYDDDSKLTTIDYPTMADVSFGYDGLDRLTNMTDGMGTTNYSYDNLDQLSSENGPWTNDTLNFAYDSLGRETGIGLNGTTVSTYGYDDLSRLSGLNSIAGNFAYSYVGNSGSLNQIDMPNGAKSTFTYDALQRLTQVQSLTSGSVNIAKFAYTLDNRDIRISIEKTFGADPMRHVNYGYDTVNQLTSAVSTETPPAVNQQWTYDPMGNRTQHVSKSHEHCDVYEQQPQPDQPYYQCG